MPQVNSKNEENSFGEITVPGKTDLCVDIAFVWWEYGTASLMLDFNFFCF